MNKNQLPELISDFKNMKSKRLISEKKSKDKSLPDSNVQKLLLRSGETCVDNVYTVDLRCEKLESIPILKEFKHLKILDLSSNCIKVLENLQYFNEMKELKLYDNQLIIISNLNKLNELVVLQAQYNQISSLDINSLSFCRKLKQIRLDNNCLNQINLEDFSKCLNLTYVDVSFNKLQCINFITFLPNLEEFYATNNMLESIPNISRCKKITEIRLNNNFINDILGIKDNKSLVILDVSNNKITSLNNLGTLNQMEFLNLAYNQITTDQMVFLLKTFPNIEILNISSNALTDIERFLEYLSNLQSLYEIFMKDNNFSVLNQETGEQYYISMISDHMPQLKMIDNVSLGKPNNQITNNALLMRPLTPAAGMSLKQVENQINNFAKAVNEVQMQNDACYKSILNALQEPNNDDTVRKFSNIRQSNHSPIMKTARRSRLSDALTFASVNYINDVY